MAEHVHWKKLTNPDYLGSYAFERGEEKVGTIRDVRQEMVPGADGKKELCTIVYFGEKDLKPLILNRTNAKMITKLYKTGFIDEWIGKQITMVVRDVRAFGETVEAVRIKNEIPARKNAAPIKCADCGKVIQAVGGYSADDIARINKGRYGRALCAECSKKLAETKSEEQPHPSAAQTPSPEGKAEPTTAQKLAEALKAEGST